MATKRRTKYQMLQAAVSSLCKGRGKKSTVTERKKAYIADAVKKGQTKAEATKKANKVVNKPCSTASVSGTKKRKTTRRKTTATKRKTRRARR